MRQVILMTRVTVFNNPFYVIIVKAYTIPYKMRQKANAIEMNKNTDF